LHYIVYNVTYEIVCSSIREQILILELVTETSPPECSNVATTLVNHPPIDEDISQLHQCASLQKQVDLVQQYLDQNQDSEVGFTLYLTKS